MNKQISNFTQTELDEAVQRKKEAQALYDEWLPNVLRWQADKAGWAERTGKFDAWEKIKENLQRANEDYEYILLQIEGTQSVQLNDLALERGRENQEEQNSFPWGTVGLSVGAIIIIVLVYKFI